MICSRTRDFKITCMISYHIALYMIYYNKPIFFLCSPHIHSSANPIHGGYSRWSNWGGCSRSCGGGIRYRYRHCNNPRPQNDGRDCSGPPTEARRCNMPTCPGKQLNKWAQILLGLELRSKRETVSLVS